MMTLYTLCEFLMCKVYLLCYLISHFIYNVYLGVVGGVYAGVEYSLERARGKQDWVSLVLLVINMLIFCCVTLVL
jgi:hypothetical protein